MIVMAIYALRAHELHSPHPLRHSLCKQERAFTECEDNGLQLGSNCTMMTNVTTGVSTTYSYNGLNQLTQASGSLSTSNYTYNGRGDLTCQSSQIGCSGTVSATYQWDVRDRLDSNSIR